MCFQNSDAVLTRNPHPGFNNAGFEYNNAGFNDIMCVLNTIMRVLKQFQNVCFKTSCMRVLKKRMWVS